MRRARTSRRGSAAADGEERRRERRSSSGRSVRSTGRRPAVDGGGRRRDGGFRQGIRLWVKIALYSAVLVAVLMTAIGTVLYRITVRELDRKINEKGANAARMLAGFADPVFWYNPLEQADEDDPLKRRTAWMSMRAFRLAEQAHNLDTLVRDPQSKIIYIEIRGRGEAATALGSMRPLQLVASYDGHLKPPDLPLFQLGHLGKVSIVEGQHPKLGRLRRFVYPIKVRPPRREGELESARRPAEYKADGYVYMRAAEVDEVKSSTRWRIITATGVGIAIAVLLAIGVSMYLAMPIRSLVNDMRVVARGDLDHKTVPRSSDEIGAAAYQFNEMTKSLKEAQRLSEEQAAIENELSIATEIQTKLLPERIPQIPGIDLFSYYLSAKEVGGDYYDFLVIDKNHLGLVVADVSGKGIPGAMVMTMVRSLLRMASQREASPSETLKKVNRILAKDIRRGMFVTAFYGVLNVQTRKLTLCSAGHSPLVYFHAESCRCLQVNPSGIALGFDKGRTFDDNLKEHTLQLGPGDRLITYTDGVIEAMNEREEEFGLKGLVEVVCQHTKSSSRDLTNAIVQALEEHRGPAEQSDDITIVTLGVA